MSQHLSINSGDNITENDYYEHIVASLDHEGDGGDMPADPLINFVASPEEWERCKAALLRWIAERDADDYSGEE